MNDRSDASSPAGEIESTVCPATCPDVCPRSSFDDAVLRGCRKVIRLSLRLLSILMALVIFWGVFDVVWVLYQRMSANPLYLLNINDILATFGAFMAVLIAIEIFENIVMYLEEHVIQIKLVLATALMAAARKVIVLDFKEIAPPYVFALAAVILALGVTYWLATRRPHNVTENRPS
jgi:uncharacterized membrane protein (DUF373 family)